MTSGSKSSGPGTGYPSTTASFQKSWNGGDGWYETWHGRVRVKYNFYEMNSSRESPLIPSVPLAFITAGGSSSSWGSLPFIPWTSRDEFQLQSKLVKRIKGHDFNLAVNLAQMHQTVSMCSNTIRKVSSSIRALKHGNIASAVRLLFGSEGSHTRLQGRLKGKDVSSQWLEMQYGWLPAISDCYEAAKAFEAYSSVRSNRVSASVKKEEAYEGSAAPSQYSCPGIARTRKRIIYEMEEDITLPRTMGLLDPLSVVWEVIPYSFVIDWFVPVGTYLETLAIVPTLTGRFVSTLYQEKQAAFKYGITPTYKVAAYRRAYFANNLRRDITAALSVQKPTFVNGPSVALSAKRIFNAIALGHQRIRDFPGSRK